LLRELVRAESLMKSAHDLDTSFYLARRLKFAKTIVTGGDNLGEVFVKAQASDILHKCIKGGGGYSCP
jgi:hypothetical protein